MMAGCRAFTLTQVAARGTALTPSPRVRGEGGVRGPLGWDEPQGQIRTAVAPTSPLRIAERPPHPRSLRSLTSPRAAGRGEKVAASSLRGNPDSRASHLDCFADARNDASPSLVTTELDPVVHADGWRTERRGKSQKRAPRMDCGVIGEPTGPARSGRPMTGCATPFFERLCPAMTMLRSECWFILGRKPLDGGAAAGELVLEPLEAAVEVIDAVDDGLAFGGERSDHERHRCA
jgi:hypothetical protein